MMEIANREMALGAAGLKLTGMTEDTDHEGTDRVFENIRELFDLLCPNGKDVNAFISESERSNRRVPESVWCWGNGFCVVSENIPPPKTATLQCFRSDDVGPMKIQFESPHSLLAGAVRMTCTVVFDGQEKPYVLKASSQQMLLF
jgi:hypothetical protein